MSYIEIIKNILTTKEISLEDLNIFLEEYIVNQLKRPMSSDQLQAIVQLITQGVFDLRFAATQAAILNNLNVLSVQDRNNNILTTIVYEEPNT